MHIRIYAYKSNHKHIRIYAYTHILIYAPRRQAKHSRASATISIYAYTHIRIYAYTHIRSTQASKAFEGIGDKVQALLEKARFLGFRV